MSPLEKDVVIEQELAQIQREIPVREHFPADVKRILIYLRDHLFEETCNVNAIKENSGVRSGDIHARFKYHTGLSIRQYIEKWRLEAATRLIRYETLKVYVIGFSVGYASYRSFDRAFRRCKGCSPTAYRKKIPGDAASERTQKMELVRRAVSSG